RSWRRTLRRRSSTGQSRRTARLATARTSRSPTCTPTFAPFARRMVRTRCTATRSPRPSCSRTSRSTQTLKEGAMKDLNGKVAVITGAGSGLGRELALCCTRRGMKLVLADVDEPGMEETLRLARDERADVEALLQKVDVSK